MAESSDEPCPRCQEPAVVYDSAGGCFVCSSCGYVVAEQGFVAQHAGPTVEQPGDAREGAGGRDRVVSAAAAAYAAAGAPSRSLGLTGHGILDPLAPGRGPTQLGFGGPTVGLYVSFKHRAT